MSEPNWKICKEQADAHMEKAETFLDADQRDVAGAHLQCVAVFMVGMYLCKQLDEVVNAIHESSAEDEDCSRSGGR